MWPPAAFGHPYMTALAAYMKKSRNDGINKFFIETCEKFIFKFPRHCQMK
jgi:hypothetical protein